MQKKTMPPADIALRAATDHMSDNSFRGLKLAAAAVAASISAFCAADTVKFPSASGDLASATAWGLAAIPGTSDAIQFTNSATVTASADIEFGGIYVGNSSRATSVTFDMRDTVSGGSPRKIKMNGNACVWNGVDANGANIFYASYTLRGGYWDFGANTVGINPPGVYRGPAGCSWKIDGGAVVVCDQLLGAQITSADRTANIRIDGEGTVVTAQMLRVANYNGSRNTATVGNGAKVVLTGTGDDVLVVDWGTGSYNSLIVTNGACVTKLVDNKKIAIGRQGSGNRLSVETGSSVQTGGTFYFGHSDAANANSSRDNRIVVRGTGSSLSLAHAMYHGNAYNVDAAAGNSNNVVYVLDGGAMDIGARWYLYGHDNGIVISNATMTMQDYLACEKSTNCYLRLQGAHPSFVSTARYGSYSTFKDGFRFCFDLPPDGFDGLVEWPYIMSNQASFDDTVSVEVTGIDRVQARMRATGVDAKTLKLAKFTNGFYSGTGITAAMLARWNEALPQGAKLRLSSNCLMLDLKAQRPTVMFLR